MIQKVLFSHILVHVPGSGIQINEGKLDISRTISLLSLHQTYEVLDVFTIHCLRGDCVLYSRIQCTFKELITFD